MFSCCRPSVPRTFPAPAHPKLSVDKPSSRASFSQQTSPSLVSPSQHQPSSVGLVVEAPIALIAFPKPAFDLSGTYTTKTSSFYITHLRTNTSELDTVAWFGHDTATLPPNSPLFTHVAHGTLSSSTVDLTKPTNTWTLSMTYTDVPPGLAQTHGPATFQVLLPVTVEPVVSVSQSSMTPITLKLIEGSEVGFGGGDSRGEVVLVKSK